MKACFIKVVIIILVITIGVILINRTYSLTSKDVTYVSGYDYRFSNHMDKHYLKKQNSIGARFKRARRCFVRKFMPGYFGDVNKNIIYYILRRIYNTFFLFSINSIA